MADQVSALELEELRQILNLQSIVKRPHILNRISSEIRRLELQTQQEQVGVEEPKSVMSKKAAKKQVVKQLANNNHCTAGSEPEFEKGLQDGMRIVSDMQGFELLTPANQAIFKIQSEVGAIFRQFLLSEGFIELHSPLYAPSREGGAAVFKYNYFGKPACLAQSPQLDKQMAICAGLQRVFMSKEVSRAEDSNTHRHLCEFTSLDVEMEIDEHYSELMDIVERLFITIFDSLNKNRKKELEAVGKQYQFTQLKYLSKTIRLTFEEGVRMLKDVGVEIDPTGDLDTEAKRKLGQLVLEKYDTEFYILHGFPLAIRPFYTMPCEDKPGYSNSFDVFVRGEEIITGGEHINERILLAARAEACGIDLKTISTYLESFKYGVRPHGGFGAGLNRIVMLFLGLDSG